MHYYYNLNPDSFLMRVMRIKSIEPENIIVEDIGMMMIGIESDHGKYSAIDQEYHQSQLQGDDNIRLPNSSSKATEMDQFIDIEDFTLFIQDVISESDWKH